MRRKQGGNILKSYKDLIVWQKSIELVTKIYELTRKLPKNEEFGLVSQMRRAAVSIPSNIAEGYLRKNRKEYIQFLYIALSSGAELETQLIICHKIYSSSDATTNILLSDISKMLYSLISKLRK